MSNTNELQRVQKNIGSCLTAFPIWFKEAGDLEQPQYGWKGKHWILQVLTHAETP